MTGQKQNNAETIVLKEDTNTLLKQKQQVDKSEMENDDADKVIIVSNNNCKIVKYYIKSDNYNPEIAKEKEKKIIKKNTKVNTLAKEKIRNSEKQLMGTNAKRWVVNKGRAGQQPNKFKVYNSINHDKKRLQNKPINRTRQDAELLQINL